MPQGPPGPWGPFLGNSGKNKKSKNPAPRPASQPARQACGRAAGGRAGGWRAAGGRANSTSTGVHPPPTQDCYPALRGNNLICRFIWGGRIIWGVTPGKKYCRSSYEGILWKSTTIAWILPSRIFNIIWPPSGMSENNSADPEWRPDHADSTALLNPNL